MVSQLISSITGASSTSSFMLETVTNLVEGVSMSSSISNLIWNTLNVWLVSILYAICQFCLQVIDLIQVIVYKFLGITTNIEDYVVFDTNNPIIKFITNDTVINVLKTVFAIAIVLVILFTILSIIIGEYNRAANSDEYSVKRIWARAFKSLLGMVAFPVVFMGCIILLNAVLAGFSSALTGGSNASVSGQLFTTCAYEANVYRNYAASNARVPIVINFSDPYDDGTYSRYTSAELAVVYQEFQEDGTLLYNMFADNDFSTWSQSVTYNYRNNTISNTSATYGSYENFMCTAEQYYVMADFIDYATANGITYYYKPLTDDDIEWKYVDDAIFDADTCSLTITYKDASNINDGDPYTVVYQSASYDVTTPIEDALNALKVMLSLNDVNYYTLERDESEINSIKMSTDKVLLKLSEDYANTDWTTSDQIILYEYYRYDSNNTLEGYTLSDLENGIYLDLYNIYLQYNRVYSGSYVDLVVGYDEINNPITKTQCAIINGNYYLVEESGDYDTSGNPIYQLVQKTDKLLQEMNEDVENKGVYIPCKGAYYSAFYSPEGTPLTSSTLSSQMLNQKGVVFLESDGVYSYGYPDINGEYHEVDRVYAELSTRHVSWPNKLVNDLQVIYNNINLAQLITTGEWLTQFNSSTLGDSGDNEYTASFDTSLISPQGLILSEMFLNMVEKSYNTNLGDYMFTNSLSDDEIKALMLALLGEYEYETIDQTLTYFLEMFNLLFEPLLEQIMTGENQTFTTGEVVNVQLFTYKAYLCSLLLSDDAAAFFLEMCQEVINLNRFGYDLLRVQPNTTAFAQNVITEYCTANYSNYMLNLEDYGINMADYGYTYDSNTNSWAEKMDDNGVSQAKTNSLINAINSAAEDLYMEFAEVVILENVVNDICYGYNLAEINSTLESGNYNFTYNNASYSYNPTTETFTCGSTSYHSVKQLPFYADLSSTVYTKLKDEFNSLDTTSSIKAVQMYKTVEANLKEQGVKPTSTSWPAYMTTYKEYITGEIDRLEIVLAKSVDTGTMYSIINDYSTYKNSLTEATNNLESSLSELKKSRDVNTVKEKISDFYSNAGESYTRYISQDDLLRLLGYNGDVNLNTAEDYALAQNVHNQLVEIVNYYEFSTSNTYYKLIDSVAKAYKNYCYYQDLMDTYNKYFISYAVRMQSSEDMSRTFKVNINNHTYTAEITIPTAKLIEYTLGSVYLSGIGYECVYVEDNYTGFFNLTYNLKGQLPELNINSASFDTIINFLNLVATKTVSSYYFSNLLNLTSANLQEEKLEELFTGTSNISYMQLILQYIVDYKLLTPEQIATYVINTQYLSGMSIGEIYTEEESAFYSLSSSYVNNLTNNQPKEIFNAVMDYLLATNNDYSKYTPKQLRLELMDALVDYIEYPGEIAYDNQQRYLTIFKLFCSDFLIGEDGSVTYGVDEATKTLVLSLCGLEDKAEQFLVGLEYTDLYNSISYDENNGDVFIICTFDEATNKYIPFMLSTNETANKSDYHVIAGGHSWLDFGYGATGTTYYSSAASSLANNTPTATAYPVIAKGVLTDDGYPTAIRINNGNVEFYRSDLTIRNASTLGLQAYYMTVDQISTNYNLFSAVFNGIYKLVKGKTFVETIYESIPRFEINSDINLPIGVNTTSYTVTNSAVTLNYSFSDTNGLSVSNFYSMLSINYFILVLSILALLPIMVKALFGVFGRVLDVTIYYIMSPVMFATISLGKDVQKNNKTEEVTPTFTNWYKQLSKKTLSVFGYVIGFMAFFILTPFISNMTLLTGTTGLTFTAPYLSKVTTAFANGFIRIVILICMAYLITSAPKLLADILNQENGLDNGKQVMDNIKSIKNDVRDTINGQKLVDAYNFAEQSVKDAVGITAAQRATGAVKKVGAKVASKGMEYAARANGVPKKEAKKAAQNMYLAVKNDVDAKQLLREERRLKAYDQQGQRVGADYVSSKQHIDEMEEVNQKLSTYKLNGKPLRRYNKAYWKKLKKDRKAK